jgi:hypothetical protein
MDGAQRARRRAQLVEHRAPECLQSPALRRPEIIGERKGGKFRQRVTKTGQCLLESHGSRGQRGLSAELGPRHIERIGQEPTTIRVVRCTVGRHQSGALACRQLMLLGRSEDGLLVLEPELGQGTGQAGTDVTAAELALGDGSQTRAQFQSTLDPVRCMPEQLCDGLGRQAVIFDQR